MKAPANEEGYESVSMDGVPYTPATVEREQPTPEELSEADNIRTAWALLAGDIGTLIRRGEAGKPWSQIAHIATRIKGHANRIDVLTRRIGPDDIGPVAPGSNAARTAGVGAVIRVLDFAGTYAVVLVEYPTQEGGGYRMVTPPSSVEEAWTPTTNHRATLLFADVTIEQVRKWKRINPNMDGRVRRADRPENSPEPVACFPATPGGFMLALGLAELLYKADLAKAAKAATTQSTPDANASTIEGQ